MKKYRVSMLIWFIFEVVAFSLYVSTKNVFYLLNFTYIGTCIGVGTCLMSFKNKYARNFVQLSVGSYMLIYLGIICRENMQIEGFWYYLFLGVFEAATIHYFVAKIAGPLFFGRGWCGYAYWTGMILDLLPFKVGPHKRLRIGRIRYVIFVVSFMYVFLLFVFHVNDLENILFYSFIIGNIIYYVLGIGMAFVLKDNRAFCKYICPVTVFLKPASYFSYLRIKCDHDVCIGCLKCVNTCPMDVDMLDDSRKRKNGTECILCCQCIEVCLKHALDIKK